MQAPVISWTRIRWYQPVHEPLHGLYLTRRLAKVILCSLHSSDLDQETSQLTFIHKSGDHNDYFWTFYCFTFRHLRATTQREQDSKGLLQGAQAHKERVSANEGSALFELA
jgi:hypothetical protein